MTIYGHRHSDHACHSLKPSVDNAPVVPTNITHSRLNNFLAGGGQFYGMGIHNRLWISRHSGSPHIQLKFYSVPDLEVNVLERVYFYFFFIFFWANGYLIFNF